MEIKKKRTAQHFLFCFLVSGFMGTIAFAEGVPSTMDTTLPPPMEKGLVKEKVSAFQKRVPVPKKKLLGGGSTDSTEFMHHGRQDKIERQVGPGTPDFVRRRLNSNPTPELGNPLNRKTHR
jgi:hypothetical protein